MLLESPKAIDHRDQDVSPLRQLLVPQLKDVMKRVRKAVELWGEFAAEPRTRIPADRSE